METKNDRRNDEPVAGEHSPGDLRHPSSVLQVRAFGDTHRVLMPVRQLA